MKSFTNSEARLLGVLMIVLMSAVYLGCGSKEKTESPAEKAAATTESAQPADDAQKAQEPYATEPVPGSQPAAESQTAPAADDWAAAYDNPKKGIDPVCGMTLEREYVEVAMIGDKKYGCCSVGCVEMLKANPDKYLKADASTETPH